MDKYGRLSRHDRQKIHHYNKIIILIPLAAIALFFLIFFFKAIIWQITIPALKDKIIGKTPYQLADSLVSSTVKRFNIAEFPRRDSIQDGGIYRRELLQNWPASLDFIYFTKALSWTASSNNLSCECEESNDGSRLFCTLQKGPRKLSQVALLKNVNTKLMQFRAALLFENINTLNIDDLTALLNTGITFSYIASPAVVPGSEIKNKMEHAGISSILILPSNIDDWARLAVNYSSNPAPNGSIDNNLVDDFLLDEVFKSHPNLFAFKFEPGGQNSSVTDIVLKHARDSRLIYYYDKDVPSAIDSLAYTNNLVLGRLDYDSNVNESGINLKNYILGKLLQNLDTRTYIINIDISKIEKAQLLQLKTEMDRLGIKFLPCNELLKIIKSF